jgi:hypothetical protein
VTVPGGTRLPQPHEGVTGIDRSGDWLLSLDEGAIVHRDVILELAGAVHRASWVGSAAPAVEALRDRVRDPRPGDLVWVLDGALSRDVDTRVKSLGFLVVCREEWAATDADHERLWVEGQHEVYDDRAAYDADRFVEHEAWYVQYGPGPADVCRWTNCTVYSAPAGFGGGWP